MNPIYKFELETVYGSGSTVINPVYPLYKNDLSKDYELEQNERFYRAKMNGQLQFVGPDYALINAAPFDVQFIVDVYISWDCGEVWTQYWRGEFYKTDCKINSDNRTIEVKLTPLDDYTAVIGGMGKEYDLISLKPVIEKINMQKRPLIQMYVPGETVVSCFLSGMHWEQDCEAVAEDETIVVGGRTVNKLTEYLYFALCNSCRTVEISGEISPNAKGTYYGAIPETIYDSYTYTKGQFRFQFRRVQQSGYVQWFWEIVRVADSVVLWQYLEQGQNPPSHITGEFILSPVDGTGATGNAYINVADVKVYGRYILDVEKISGVDTQPIPADDIVANNRNYKRVVGYGVSDAVAFTTNTSTTPTEWGIMQPGVYYAQPYSILGAKYYPIGRTHWSNISIWFAFSAIDWILEESGRKDYMLKDTHPLSSVISVLLGQIAPGITHEATTEYSEFLYSGNNPISGYDFELFITQKSNILAGDYQQPAQKAPITLRMITDMLRDCFCAYWFIEDGKFRIEHISWFKNGGSYTDLPIVSHDLTNEEVRRNGKKWAYQTSQYNYDKSRMPERYQFGWMDDVTNIFEGSPIEVQSKFVEPGNIEQITVTNFTSDVDYMILNPGACSKDGFALLSAIRHNLITPDVSYRTIIIGEYNPVYDLGNILEGEEIQLNGIIDNTEALGYISFLDASDNPITDIFEYSTDGEINVAISATVPKNAVKIGVIQYSRMGTSEIQMLSILSGKALPFVEQTIDGFDYVSQNGMLSFANLQPLYYVYDLPAYNVKINGQTVVATGIKRNKKQSIQFPVHNDPNPMQLIRTYLGDGQIEKLSINLSSRNANATLRFDTYEYDTEQ